MVIEHAPSDRRGLYGSLVQIGGPLGTVTSTGVFAVMTTMPVNDFNSWGWRIPFLISILLLGVGWFVRARVPETPMFEQIAHIQESRFVQPNKKRFTVRKIVGSGELWITEFILSYDDMPSYAVSIMEFREGLVASPA
jgi:MFS family permease